MKSLAQKAAAIELLLSGITVTEVARVNEVGVPSVGRWFLNYLGYRGKEGFVISFPSKLNDMKEEIEMEDSNEN